MISEPLRHPLSLFDVKDKVAIVTGASGAFGRGCAIALGALGARLLLVSGSKSELEDVAAEVREVGGTATTLVRRPDSGLLGGMMMPPSSEWRAAKQKDALEGAPLDLAWEHVGEVRHVFTHFALRLDVYRAEAPARAKVAGEWLTAKDALAALPTVGRKAVALALGGASARRRVS